MKRAFFFAGITLSLASLPSAAQAESNWMIHVFDRNVGNMCIMNTNPIFNYIEWVRCWNGHVG